MYLTTTTMSKGKSMEINKNNEWVGTYSEHLEKLLETHIEGNC